MSNFTPGPWSHIGQGDITGREDNGGTVDVCCVYLRTAPGRTEANAALIAAAPALYEALKDLLADIENYQSINLLNGYNNSSQVNARAALALVGDGE